MQIRSTAYAKSVPPTLAPLALGTWAAAVALAPGIALKLALAAPLPLAAALWWMVREPSRWMLLFFFCLLLTPPMPLPLGDSGVHAAPLIAAVGILAGVIFARGWRPLSHPLTLAFAAFLAALLGSVAFAFLYSGWAIGFGSLARVLLFAIGVYVFFYSLAGPGQDSVNDLRNVRLLFGLGVAGAVFACADFYFQLPAPAGYSDQFVWLDEGVLRRAQGLFYEASTLGNVCAFFLVMIAVSLFRKREQSPCSRKALLIGGLALAAALMFSYSRASVFNVAVAFSVLACIRLRRFRRSVFWMLAAAAGAGAMVNLLLPSFSSNYWGRLLGSFSFFWQSPDAVLSGRLGHWQTLFDFLEREPWHAVFGIGYKTLPYSNFTGAATIADNTYLDLLVETGIVGLAAFLAWNAMILRTGWRALCSPNPATAFLGEWIFCFWCGQMVQMFSGDLITYWRALPIYFCVLGAAARQAREHA
jgi:O-antigen ligase